ncbi:hypothetical protein KJ359_011949 [Pestalotiopsis sp. 9143b]|nr:hypothetical protein KJ359_011949 [Pestalotiopsis sp. 9143b]
MSSLETNEFLAMFGLEEPEKRLGTGRILATEFRVPTLPMHIQNLVSRRGFIAPEDIFTTRPGLQVHHMERLTNRYDPMGIVLLTAGACTHNDQAGAKAAWAFQFGPEPEMRTCARRLEETGPFGHRARQTANRAELRAVIAAIRCRPWADDGYQTVVIATDSEYVVKGATSWIRHWIQNGWKTLGGYPIQNQDLWELLLGEFERFREARLRFQFWRVSREAIALVDDAAKKACEEGDVPNFCDQMMPGI